MRKVIAEYDKNFESGSEGCKCGCGNLPPQNDGSIPDRAKGWATIVRPGESDSDTYIYGNTEVVIDNGSLPNRARALLLS